MIQAKPGLLKKRAVAERLGVSTKTVDRLRGQGRLTAIKLNGECLFDPDAIEKLIADCMEDKATDCTDAK